MEKVGKAIRIEEVPANKEVTRQVRAILEFFRTRYEFEPTTIEGARLRKITEQVLSEDASGKLRDADIESEILGRFYYECYGLNSESFPRRTTEAEKKMAPQKQLDISNRQFGEWLKREQQRLHNP